MARVIDQPATAQSMARRVRRLLDEAGAPLTGQRVLTLCSGGADSVALVALLAALPTGAAPRSIDVLFLDHALRDDVTKERAAAHAVAERIGASFHEQRCDARLDTDPRGIEAAARAWRLEAAARMAQALDASVVCTGHTADDQLEQALLALIGVTGRGGDVNAMPVMRPLVGGIRLARPLLSITRSQIEAVCAELGLAWGMDPTNVDPSAHVRNAVRANVVPPLIDLHAGAGAAIVRAAARRREQSIATRALARALAREWTTTEGQLGIRSLSALPPAARRELIAAWLEGDDPERGISSRIIAAVEQLATAPARAACARVDLPGGRCVRRDGYDLTITPAQPPTEGPP